MCRTRRSLDLSARATVKKKTPPSTFARRYRAMRMIVSSIARLPYAWARFALPTLRSTFQREVLNGLLAFENRARGIFLERSGQTRRQGRAVDRRAQLHRPPIPEGDEAGRARLVLSHRRGEAGRRHRRGDPRELSRSHRREGRVSRGRRQGGETVPETGDAGGDQERVAAQGDGACEISARIGAAGDRAGMEDRAGVGWRKGLAGFPARDLRHARARTGCAPSPGGGGGWGGGQENQYPRWLSVQSHLVGMYRRSNASERDRCEQIRPTPS